MVTEKVFWDYISNSTFEYLSIRYFNKSRILLSEKEKNQIFVEESKILNKHREINEEAN